MAQKTVVLLTDDIDGGEADETLTFAIDGKTYEIDLSDKNAAKLRKALDPFQKAARRTGKATAGNRGRSSSTSGGNQDTAAIRAWAKENGHDVNDRGRVPQSIRDAYSAATK
ncbi:Lsr2 family protein [Streptomyces sp. NPDC047525]|uniref:histone-like nucleoid-structuring protein Lsr2 n=1 Tax=Streptomyces sp. NPDC047525 TaxID=3155264 RepID=UPI0033E0949A